MIKTTNSALVVLPWSKNKNSVIEIQNEDSDDNFDDKIIRYLLLLNEETMANDMLKKENRDAFALP